MRQIKFRAWDKKNKIMQFVYSIMGNREHFTSAETGFYEGGELSTTRESTEGLVLMQFTGLKDKKGKEIYEGDILFIKGKNKITIGYVSIDSKYGFILNGHTPKGKFDKDDMENIEKLPQIPNFYFFDDLEIEITTDSNSLRNVKLIGNIYENKELIK